MDRKTLLILLYITAVLPISFTLGQWFSPEGEFFWFGIINTVALILFSLLFGHTTSKRSKRRKFLLALLVLFIAGLLFTGAIDNTLRKSSEWFSEQLSDSPVEIVAPSTQTLQEVEKEVKLTDEENNEIKDVKGNNDTRNIILESDNDIEQEVIKNDFEIIPEKKQITVDGTYATLIPYMVEKYNLKDTDKSNPDFEFVSRSSDLYKPFAIAYSKAMIGKDLNPTRKVSCNTYMVLKGLAQGRDVEYNGLPFSSYRAEAKKRGQENGCIQGSYLTTATL